MKQSAPSFGFGTSKRPDISGNSKNQVPGPGAYKLPSKIADTPEFALKRSPESKYVWLKSNIVLLKSPLKICLNLFYLRIIYSNLDFNIRKLIKVD